uniref:Uncharacterized protein n=1 Tax=Monopterus albus TaxID=43700 RepID=A0A3Q3K817_MONAL
DECSQEAKVEDSGDDGGKLTSRCSSVKITGSATNTRLDSLVIEAERMWELTVRERLRLFRSPIPLSVAFSKRPHFLR